MTAGQLDLFSMLDAQKPEPASCEWRAPPVDRDWLERLLDNGRSPFGGEEYDEAAMQSIADETVIGLAWELCSIAQLEQAHRAGSRAFRTRKQWETFDRTFQSRCQFHRECYDATLAEVADLWRSEGMQAFDAEARRRAATSNQEGRQI